VTGTVAELDSDLVTQISRFVASHIRSHPSPKLKLSRRLVCLTNSSRLPLRETRP
jgi:hypothetical protein